MSTVSAGQSRFSVGGLSAPAKARLRLYATFGCAAAALMVLPAVAAGEVPGSQSNGAQITTVAAAATGPGHGATAAPDSSVADTSPSCPGAYECLQPGTDPQVPYGTDPFVPYGTGMENSRPPFGHGSSSYTGGAF
jgi:hypothetical protein